MAGVPSENDNVAFSFVAFIFQSLYAFLVLANKQVLFQATTALEIILF